MAGVPHRCGAGAGAADHPGAQPIALVGSGFALLVPPSFYEGDAARRATLIAVVLAAGVLGVLLARRRRVRV